MAGRCPTQPLRAGNVSIQTKKNLIAMTESIENDGKEVLMDDESKSLRKTRLALLFVNSKNIGIGDATNRNQ